MCLAQKEAKGKGVRGPKGKRVLTLLTQQHSKTYIVEAVLRWEAEANRRPPVLGIADPRAAAHVTEAIDSNIARPPKDVPREVVNSSVYVRAKKRI